MRFWPLLADHAQALGGKLYLMGGGWKITGPGPVTGALAGILELDWLEANQPKHFRVELLTEDGQPVSVPTPMGDQPVRFEASIEVGRPPGTRPGSSFNVPLALNIGPLPIPPGGRYVWQFSIDGHSSDDWRLPFSTRPALQPPQTQSEAPQDPPPAR